MFVKYTVAALAVLTLAGGAFAAGRTITTDLVVVGAGAGGLTAGVAATDAGARKECHRGWWRQLHGRLLLCELCAPESRQCRRDAGAAIHPLRKQNVDLDKSDTYTWTTTFLEELKIKQRSHCPPDLRAFFVTALSVIASHCRKYICKHPRPNPRIPGCYQLFSADSRPTRL